MNPALRINQVLLSLLAVSTGAVKIGHLPAEMALFRGAGVADGVTVGFGVLQLGLGVLLWAPRASRGAAWGLAATFGLATGVVFVNGLQVFGVVSLLFIVSAVVQASRGPRGFRR